VSEPRFRVLLVLVALAASVAAASLVAYLAHLDEVESELLLRGAP